MLKRLTQLAIIGFLLCSLPMPVEARSSSSSSSSSSRSSSPSSSSSSSSFKSSPSTSSYSRSSSSTSQTKPSTSSSSSNSQSTFGSYFNSSYSSHPVVTKPAQAVTTEKPKTPTTYLPEYKLPNTTGKTETRYVTIFSDSGSTRTVPVVVPFGYTQPIVLPQTYYPATTVTQEGSWVGTFLAIFIGLFFFVVISVIIGAIR